MIYLKSSNFIGVHSKHGVSNINFEKRMTVLTGFNGAGKSTILSGIFLSLDGLSKKVQRPLFSAKKEWGIELNLIDDKFYENYRAKFKDVNLPNTKLKINIKNLIKEQSNIEEVQKVSQNVAGKEQLNLIDFYSFIDDEFKKTRGGTNVTSKALGRIENFTNIFTVSVNVEKPTIYDISKFVNLYNKDLQSDSEKVSVALFRDEQFFYSNDFNNINNLSGLDVFSQNNNLDKSIFILLSSFRSKVLSSDQELSRVISNEFKENQKNIEHFSNNQLEDFLKKLISKKRFTDDATFFIEKLNLFFNQVNKSAYLEEDGLISFKETIKKKSGNIENIVKWFDCSKGEKTLICLLLIVFLYKDTNTIYLLDEPDLAMHIEWQRLLLPIFLEIAPNSQFVISTHSPALIPRDVSDVGFINVSKLKEKVEYESE